MLHITNGESVVTSLKAGHVAGAHLAWDDPLHDGPVPLSTSLDELSDVRARALSGFGWGSYPAIRQRFAERDSKLSTFDRYEETVLWFEHDLYDQLQLLQLLDWFSSQDMRGRSLSIIQVGDDLGPRTGSELAALLPTRVPVSRRRLEIGRTAWHAFRSTDPSRLVEFATSTDPAMPFLAPALQRLLEEYPSSTHGLSRSEQQLLVSAALGARTRDALYQQSQSFEKCSWGDASVFLRLDGLAGSVRPALDRLEGGAFAINPLGVRLLSAEDDWLRVQGSVDRWIGGVHITGPDVRWRWNAAERKLE